MKIRHNNGTIAITTGLTPAQLKKPIILKDEKGNDVYYIAYSCNGTGNLTENGIETNTVVDGEAAYVFVAPNELESIRVLKEEKRTALLKAHQACEVAAQQAKKDDEEFESFWMDAAE